MSHEITNDMSAEYDFHFTNHLRCIVRSEGLKVLFQNRNRVADTSNVKGRRSRVCVVITKGLGVHA